MFQQPNILILPILLPFKSLVDLLTTHRNSISGAQQTLSVICLGGPLVSAELDRESAAGKIQCILLSPSRRRYNFGDAVPL
jgi:hypothetical protein